MLERDLDDVEIELIPAGGGVFEVVADGTLVHSKKKTGRFPEPAKLVDTLRGMG